MLSRNIAYQDPLEILTPLFMRPSPSLMGVFTAGSDTLQVPLLSEHQNLGESVTESGQDTFKQRLNEFTVCICEELVKIKNRWTMPDGLFNFLRH